MATVRDALSMLDMSGAPSRRGVGTVMTAMSKSARSAGSRVGLYRPSSRASAIWESDTDDVEASFNGANGDGKPDVPLSDNRDALFSCPKRLVHHQLLVHGLGQPMSCVSSVWQGWVRGRWANIVFGELSGPVPPAHDSSREDPAVMLEVSTCKG